MIGAELSHCDQRVRDVATSGHREFVQLIVHHLPQQAGSNRPTIASGIASIMVGAVMLATVVPDRSRPMQERLYGIFRVRDDGHLESGDFQERAA
jgi:hypothetical protein